MGSSAFRDRVVLITGASSGIGRELALQLAGQGAWLALAARDARRLEEAASRCIALGGKAIAMPTDVAERVQCESLIGRTVEAYGRLDALVNNAGITMWAKFDDLNDPSVLEPIMRVNFFGGVYCTYYALPHLKRTRGLIVGISSLTGKTGVPTRSGYAASKHAMAGFFDSLRIELAPSGVGVTMIYPGFVTTEVRERALGPDGRPLGASPVQEEKVMSVERCARIILKAMERRRREVVMTARGKAGAWLKLVAPGLVDRMALRAIERGR